MGLQPMWGVPAFSFPTICPPPVFVGMWPPCIVGAGGIFGPPLISQFRFFVTPTITGAV